MANPEHVKVAQQGAVAIAAWRREHPEETLDLSGANLSWADLSGADLREANLGGADLRGADLDYSCWPLWCGTMRVKMDKRLAAQLAAHLCALDCEDPEYKAAREALLPFARTSHRAKDLGL